MCTTCGCSDGETMLTNLETGNTQVLEVGGHGHVHADGTWHDHDHAHDHEHSHDHDHDHDHHAHDHGHSHGDDHAHGHAHDPAPVTTTLDLNARILEKNDRIADRNRAWLAGRDILALNLMSGPGAGKTTLLERTIAEMKAERSLFVLEGDQATANDGDRVKAAGAVAIQINTGSGCHLDAEMVARGLGELRPSPGSLLFIENVGNLVCPALFDLGEAKRVAILSVTEGEDKPAKYPHMFRAADLMLINKIDLLPHVDFDMDRAVAHAREVNPEIEVLRLSARTGEGFEAWRTWIETARTQALARVFP